MRLVLSEFISLDGVIQAPGGRKEDTDGDFQHGGWSMRYFDMDAMGSAIDESMQKTDAYVFGRRTWQVSAEAWPQRQGQDPFADKLNSIPKYVASRTLSQDDLTAWNNSHLLDPDDALGAIAKLKTQDGGDISCYGSANFAAQLIENDLVDEYNLMIEPVILGGGKRLFPEDGVLRGLELVSSVTAGTGVQICRYRRP
ncbi:MAG TPA: dihydrofolate reductase family protein [Actinomycetota bacterium]|nr:dihydrofolate reductase family protein [Actinomycetota bacterium]